MATFVLRENCCYVSAEKVFFSHVWALSLWAYHAIRSTCVKPYQVTLSNGSPQPPHHI